MPSVVKPSSILRWTAFVMLAFAALVRAQSLRARLPYWDLDPFLVDMPETALLYSHAFALDALVWLAAAAAIAAESLAGRRLHWKSGLLVLLGVVGVALHGLYFPPPGASSGVGLRGDFMALALGSAWAAAVVGGWTMLHLARDPALRRVAAFTLVGFAITLTAKGAYQVYVEHAYTVRAFKADPAAVLTSNGLQPGSTGAKEFERRLMQPEAIGWFGLANVYGSFVAAAVVFFLTLTITSWKLVRAKAITSGPAGLISLALLISAFGLYLSGSKGALGAALAGCVVLSLPLLSGRGRGEKHPNPTPAQPRSSPRTPKSPPSPASANTELAAGSSSSPTGHWLLPTGLCFLTLLAVALRGLIGERIAELSLLFRWHYLVAATRIFASDPITGVGPTGFKPAYAIHKVPINPEQVESPHSVLFDWSATLGLFGLAWCAFLVFLLLRAGRNLATPSLTLGARQEGRGLLASSLLAITLAASVAWLRELPVITADEWPLRLIALAAWGAVIIIGARIVALAPRAFNLALIAAATTLAVHAMIEMTPTQPGSALLWMLTIACAAAVPAAVRSGMNPRLAPLVVSLPVLVAAGIGIAAISPARALETNLRSAARETAVARELLAAGASLPESEQDSSRDNASRALGRAADLLQRDWSIQNEVTETIIAIRFRQFALHETESLADALILDSQLRHLASIWLDSPRMQARVAAARSALIPLSSRFSDNPSVLVAWTHASFLDPYSLTLALSAYDAARRLGYLELARSFASRALRNNDLLRLDPLKQLDPALKAELERFLADTTPDPDQNPSAPLTPAQTPPAFP